MKKIKKSSGFTIIELVVVMLIIGVLTIVYMNFFKNTDDSKITMLSSTVKEHINFMRIEHIKNGKLDDLNGDNNYLDDLINTNKIKDLEKRDLFEEPNNVKYELRKVEENNNVSIFVILETTNDKDKHIIDEAIKLLSVTDESLIKETF